MNLGKKLRTTGPIYTRSISPQHRLVIGLLERHYRLMQLYLKSRTRRNGERMLRSYGVLTAAQDRLQWLVEGAPCK